MYLNGFIYMLRTLRAKLSEINSVLTFILFNTSNYKIIKLFILSLTSRVSVTTYLYYNKHNTSLIFKNLFNKY